MFSGVIRPTVALWLFATGTVAAEAPVRAVATVSQLHEVMIKPASDTMFNAARRAPAGDGDWTVLRRAAITLAESGNLLMIGARARDQGRWMKLSRELLDVSGEAATAAGASNLDLFIAISDRLVDVCESCHVRYRSPGDKARK